MPRNDKTFSDSDLLRFWTLNLTEEEQRDVLLTFVYGMSLADGFKSFVLAIIDLALQFLPLGPLWRRIFNAILRLAGLESRLDSLLIRSIARRSLVRAKITEREWVGSIQRAKDIPFS